MKQVMIDMMTAMMPFMRPLSIVAAVLIVIGLVLGVVARLGGGSSRLGAWCGLGGLLAGIFFLACEAAGRFLGFEPTILYAAPIDRELFRNQWPFWTIGGALLLLGFIVRRLAGAGGR